MALNFENASVLSLEKTNKYFDSEYVFSTEKRITVNGFFHSPSNTEGVKEIQNDLEAFIASTEGEVHDVIINGHDFGEGKVTSFSSDSDNSVRLKNYTVGLVIYETGDLSSLTSDTYMEAFQGIINDPDRKYIKGISENFSFQKNDGQYNYNHELGISFVDTGSNDPIGLAQDLAKTILETDVDFGFIDQQVGGFYNLQHKKIYSESYDKINKSCSFKEDYSQLAATDEDYSSSTSTTVNLEGDGVVTVSESGQLAALIDATPTQLRGYVDTEIAGSWERAQDFFDSFMKGYYLNVSLSGSSEVNDELISQFISLDKTFDIFNKSGTYSISYTNNENVNTGYIAERTIDVQEGEETRTVSEKGSITGLSDSSNDDADFRYNKATTAYQTIKAAMEVRLSNYYKDVFNTAVADIYSTSKSFTSNPPEGKLEYRGEYTDSPTRSDSLFKEITTSENVTYGMPLKNDFRIVKSNVVACEQHLGMLTPANKRAEVKVSGKRRSAISDLRVKAVSIINDLKPPLGTRDLHLSEVSHTIDEKNKVFNLTASWVYYDSSGSLCGRDGVIGEDLAIRIIEGLITRWEIDGAASILEPSYGCGAGQVVDVSGNLFNGITSYINFGRGPVGGGECPTGTLTDCPEVGDCYEYEDPVYVPCPTPSWSPTPTATKSSTPTATKSSTPTASGTLTASKTATKTPMTLTGTRSPSFTPTISATPSTSASVTIKWSDELPSTPSPPFPTPSETPQCLVELDCPACGWDEIFVSRNFSISMWFNRSGSTTGGVLLYKFTYGFSEFHGIQITEDGYFRCGNSSEVIVGNSETISTNEWHHLVVAVNSAVQSVAGVEVYLNGEKIAYQGDGIEINKSNNSSMVIGAEGAGTGDFSGNIADLRIYNRAIQEHEVKWIYEKIDQLPDGTAAGDPY